VAGKWSGLGGQDSWHFAYARHVSFAGRQAEPRLLTTRGECLRGMTRKLVVVEVIGAGNKAVAFSLPD